MKLFTVKLSDEERAGLEHYRAHHALRSQSEAVRHMIANGLVAHRSERPPVERRVAGSTPAGVATHVLVLGDTEITEGTLDPATWKTRTVKREPFRGVTATGEPLPNKAWSNLKPTKGAK